MTENTNYELAFEHRATRISTYMDIRPQTETAQIENVKSQPDRKITPQSRSSFRELGLLLSRLHLRQANKSLPLDYFGSRMGVCLPRSGTVLAIR